VVGWWVCHEHRTRWFEGLRFKCDEAPEGVEHIHLIRKYVEVEPIFPIYPRLVS